LVLNLVFLKLHPEQGEELTLSAADHADISSMTNTIAEAMWTVAENQGLVTRRVDAATGAEVYESPRHFKTVFSNPEDCRRLRNGTLAHLVGPAASPATPPSVPAPAVNS
jgi:hypothetical protein